MRTLDDLRRFAVTQSLFAPTTLERALDALAFVQADPIRAPARAQDLTLRPRVEGYRAGDLEREYSTLPVEEDVFLNYGFVTRSLQALMHPRTGWSRWPTARSRRAKAVLAFVTDRTAVHPREVESHFSHGTVTNYWGGTSHATTHLLDLLHYQGKLRVARRERGIRIYEIHQHGSGPPNRIERQARIDALVDAAVRIYEPLPAASLSFVVGGLRYAVPQWRNELSAALTRARLRLAHARIDGVDWYWTADSRISGEATPTAVRFLAPFDPVVWDRRRFEMLWGWAYRFEAYTPKSKRKLGYYALPLLWRDRIVGWTNVSVVDGVMHTDIGYVSSRPRERAFKPELDAEVERMRAFLSVLPGT
jgi:hypothetical protein